MHSVGNSSIHSKYLYQERGVGQRERERFLSEREMEGMKLLLPLFFSVSGNLSRYEHVIELSDFSLEIFIFFIQDDPRAKPNMSSIAQSKKEFSVSTPEVKLAVLNFIM